MQELNKYTNILPKSIQINIYDISITFFEKIIEIFDRSITSFDLIDCRGTVKKSYFLPYIAKKVDIKLEDLYNEYKVSIFEENHKIVTD